MMKEGCGCENGNVFVYFKHEARHGIRCDCYDCPTCKPDGNSVLENQIGEEEITLEEFNQLVEQDWESLVV